MVLNATFNNISGQSVVLVEELRVPADTHRPEITTLVVIGIDCICSGRSNYLTITTTMAV